MTLSAKGWGKLLPGAAFAGALVVVSGCTSAADKSERVGLHQAAIQGGELDPDTRNVFALFNFPRQSICSASLISANVLLTARHCVAGLDVKFVTCGDTPFGPTDAPTSFLATTAAEVDSSNVGEYRVQAVMVPESSPNDICGGDVAIVVLSENVDPDELPPMEPRLDDPLQVDEVYDAVGYGGVDKNGADSGKRRRRSGLKVTCAGKDCELDAVTNTEWLGETGVCQGDSGGPAIDEQGRVAGIVSRGSEDCGFPIYGDTNGFADFIKDSVVKASGMGLYTAPDWTAGSTEDPTFSMPIGQLCDSNADCPTERCVVEGEGRACTRPCDIDHPCPVDYTCESEGNEQLCIAETVVPPPAFKRAERQSGCAWNPRKAKGQPADWRYLGLIFAAALWRLQRRSINRVRPSAAKDTLDNGQDGPRRMR